MATIAELSQANRRIPTLDALYTEADRLRVTPGWIPRDKPILWPQPKSEFVPCQWRYAEVKEALAAAGSLVDVALAERRNLVLRNPIPGNGFATTRTLVCAYQMILPGEVAPSHKHSSHALRVILESKGSFSVVNGEKTPMESGDVVLTPGNFWHGHGHDGDEPAYWFDGLDVPLTHLLEPMFFQEHPDKYEKIATVATVSPFRFSRDSIAAELDRARPSAAGHYGARIKLAAPDMPPMSLAVERLPSGMKRTAQRSTANRIFVVMEGAGESVIGNEHFTWRFGDTLAIPCWTRFEHRASSDATLFEMSDEALMRFAGYYREEVG
jgi:gentisate 1,2-dioxygenase